MASDPGMTTPRRLRKAWRVTVKGYDDPAIIYAATGGRARMDAWRSIDGGIRIGDITVRRWRLGDVTLPVRDPLADTMTEAQRHCLLHAFGGNRSDPTKAGNRDYFYTRRDDPPLVGLADLGLMEPMDGDRWGENMTYFVLTDRGKHVALSMIPEYAA